MKTPMEKWMEERKKITMEYRCFPSPLEWLIQAKEYSCNRVYGNVCEIQGKSIKLDNLMIDICKGDKWMTSVDVSGSVVFCENDIKSRNGEFEVFDVFKHNIEDFNNGDRLELWGEFNIQKNDNSIVLVLEKLKHVAVIIENLEVKKSCDFCKYSEKHYPSEIPSECKECGFFNERGMPQESIQVRKGE